MGTLLRPDLKALVWLGIGFFVAPLVISKIRAKTGH